MNDALPYSIDPVSVHRHTLPNGLKVLIRRDRSAPVVAIVTYVSAGYFDETDDIVGIAHVLEHMYFKGTPSRGVGEIARHTKAAGGYLNAATIYDHTSYYTVLPSSAFAQGLEIQADAYANSLIDEQELARELEVIIQEVKRKEDNPGAVAVETLYELLHDAHRIRRWRMGREEGLRTFVREGLLGFYRNFYHPGNTVLAIVGDVDPAAALRDVDRLYGSLPAGSPQRTPGPAEADDDRFRFREWSGDIGQTQIALGWRTPGTMHADTPLLDLAAAMLGSGRASRLYRGVREHALVSSIHAYNYTPTELGVFVIHAEAPPEKAAGALPAIWKQVAQLRDGMLGALELERAKRIYESQWLRRLEDMEGQANYLAEWEALGDWQQGERYMERLLTATLPQVNDAAKRWLDPDRTGVLIYRPDQSPPIADTAERMRDLLDSAAAPVLERIATYQASAPAVIGVEPALEREEAGVRVYRTHRGVPVLVRVKAGAPLVHAGVFARGGAVDDPAELAGLTALMARTAIKGTARRTAAQIAEEAELLGGSIGYSMGADSFGWSISVPGARRAAAAELLADVVQHAAFADDALETERAVAIADVIALRDDMYRYPMRLAMLAAFEGHAYGNPVSGSESSLPRITAGELRRCHERQLRRAPTVIALVGDGDPAELARVAVRAFTDLESDDRPAPPAPQWPSASRSTIEERDRAQTALAMLFPAPGRQDPDRFAAEMIAGVASGLGGRFFEELRDKQSLSYTVHAFAAERWVAGSFGAYIATSPEKENAARDGLLAEFQKLCDAPVTDEELERAKRYAIGVHQIQRQSGGAVLGEIVDAWLFGSLSELPGYEAAVEAVTAEQMQRLAQRYFDPTRRVEGIVRAASR